MCPPPLVSAIQMDNKNLRAGDSRQKSVVGAGDVKITASVWSAISCWNASRILTVRGRGLNELDVAMVHEMETNPVAMERIKSKDEWVKVVLNAIIKKEGSAEFMDGEESTNWPKIKQSDFKQGITVAHITSIIMAHREALKKWAKQQADVKAKQKAAKTVVKKTLVAAEEVVADHAEEKADAVIAEQVELIAQQPVEVPESWEDL